MSRALDHPVRFELLPGYCPECRANVEHSEHRDVPEPEGGLPPVGEYAPEYQPVEQERGR